MEKSSGIDRVYKLNWRGWVFPLLCLATGSADAVVSLTEVHSAHQLRLFRTVISSVILLLTGAFLAAVSLTTKVILSNNAVEQRNIFNHNTLLFSEIRGRRESVQRDLTGLTTRWKLEPKDKSARPIEVSTSFTLDDVFCEWFDQLPDLDMKDVD
jgi:hypothetical protein